MKKEGAGGVGDLITGKKKDITVVAEDKNWRLYVANELKGVDNWKNDWGFLVPEGKYQNLYHFFNRCLNYSK